MTALWQAPLTNATVTGGLVVGLAAGRPDVLEALSEGTGRQLWTASLPSAEPYVEGLFAAGGVLVAEVGRSLNDPAGTFAVMRYVVFDAHSGRQLWSTDAPGGVPTYFEGKPVAYAGGVIVTGGASGELTGHDARTGAVVWTRSRPSTCPQSGEPEFGYDERLAGTGNLLVASYQCKSGKHWDVLVERLAPGSGAPVWHWQSPLAGMSVAGVATHGGLVLLAGQAGEDRYARGLREPRLWPKRLGYFGGNFLVLALNAATGAPRWSERGGQLEEFTDTDGVVCETVQVGFECRDDQIGLHTRPVLAIGHGEGTGPIYEGDGTAGISGSVAGIVLSRAHSGAITIGVFPLRGASAIARATVSLGKTVAGEGKSRNFIVAAGPIRGGGTILFLRRVDVADTPLVALRVSTSSGR